MEALLAIDQVHHEHHARDLVHALCRHHHHDFRHALQTDEKEPECQSNAIMNEAGWYIRWKFMQRPTSVRIGLCMPVAL